jgi:hypothetical protein
VLKIFKNLHSQPPNLGCPLGHPVLLYGVNLKHLRYGLRRKLPACVFPTELTSARRGFFPKRTSPACRKPIYS